MLTEAQKFQAFAAKQPTSQRPAAAIKVLTPSTTISLCVSALQAATVGAAAPAGLK